jgi:hypothetical protein
MGLGQKSFAWGIRIQMGKSMDWNLGISTVRGLKDNHPWGTQQVTQVILSSYFNTQVILSSYFKVALYSWLNGLDHEKNAFKRYMYIYILTINR